MKNFLFVIDSLEIGGAEKVLVELANELANTCKVTIVTIYDGQLSSKINGKISLKVIIKDQKNKHLFWRIYSVVKRVFFIRFPSLFIPSETYSKKTIIAFLENQSISVVRNLECDCEKIAWIHTSVIHQNKRFKHRERIYQAFSKIIFSSESVKRDFHLEYKGVSGKKQKVIYNGLDLNNILRMSECDYKKIDGVDYSVSVGRLCDAKNYLNLIDTLLVAYNDGYQLNHYIIGDGPDKEIINERINALGLQRRVFLLGSLDNPYPYIKNAKLFIHNALWEGFGLAVVEAIVLNTIPIVRKNGATNEVISLLQSGFLFESDDELIKLIIEYQYKTDDVFSENVRKLSYSTMSNTLQGFIDD